MKQENALVSPALKRARAALREALARSRPDIVVDDKGYVSSFRENLVPLVALEDFEADLSQGDGNELESKFRAAHSSSALGVNCFSPFRRQMSDLVLPGLPGCVDLQFERKCPTGLRGGKSPNLDVLASGPMGVVGIESKLTEYLSKHSASFSPAYADQIRDARREQGYFREMERLMDAPNTYVWLDAAQLIKHAFGLARTFGDQPTTLLYLYWEPANPECSAEFAQHRREIELFAERVSGSTPTFVAMSYPELWASWRRAAPEWLVGHMRQLEARYLVRL